MEDASRSSLRVEDVQGFLARTSLLTPGEQAELLGAIIETAGTTAQRSSPQSTTRSSPQPTTRSSPQSTTRSGPTGGTGSTTGRTQSQRSQAAGGGGTRQPATTGSTGARQPATGGAGTRQPAGSAGTRQPAVGGAGTRQRAGGSQRSSPDLNAIFGGVQQGLGYFTQGAQAVSTFASLFGGDRTAQDISRVAGQLAQGGSQVGSFMQGFQGGGIPPLPQPGVPPGQVQEPTMPMPQGMPPQQGMPWQQGMPMPQQGMPMPQQGMPWQQGMPMPQQGAPGMGTQSGQANAMAFLTMLLSDPRLLQTFMGSLQSGTPRPVELTLPAENGESQRVAIPLEDVLHTIAELAVRSAGEVAAGECACGRERASEYIYTEDGAPLIDGSNPAERAALTLHYFRTAAEAARFGEVAEDVEASDEAALWAIEAGFDY
ncbi:MAG: hypothetical protein IPK82_40255 [Polyangiaceae bacterium]|nr:hypothetical protein [Polyangiaceae bacterium]